jgi:hypothetical protein
MKWQSAGESIICYGKPDEALALLLGIVRKGPSFRAADATMHF